MKLEVLYKTIIIIIIIIEIIMLFIVVINTIIFIIIIVILTIIVMIFYSDNNNCYDWQVSCVIIINIYKIANLQEYFKSRRVSAPLKLANLATRSKSLI